MLGERRVGPVRVILADDHAMVLEAFCMLLASEVDVVATAADGHELIRAVKEHKPDVVVTDISMPVLNGVDACSKLLKILPELKIIFLTVNDDPDLVAEVIRNGAKGYLLKNSASGELLQAIKAVASGSTYITPLVTERMIGSLVEGSRRDLSDKLTVRQREILQLLAEGNTMQQAAKILSVTPRTVAFHKYRIMESLGIKNNSQLVRYAIKIGLLES